MYNTQVIQTGLYDQQTDRLTQIKGYLTIKHTDRIIQHLHTVIIHSNMHKGCSDTLKAQKLRLGDVAMQCIWELKIVVYVQPTPMKIK